MFRQKLKSDRLKEKIKSPKENAFITIFEGMKVSHTYLLNEFVYRGFLTTFKDHNPIHIDATFAQKKGFKNKMMHGGILSGFLSHFIGMYFPGKDTLLLSSSISFLKPCYLGDQIELECTVKQKSESLKVLSLLCAFRRSNETVARSQVQVKCF